MTPSENARRTTSSMVEGPSAMVRTVLGADDLGDAHAVLLVEDDDLAVGDDRAVDEDVDGAAGDAVELDDRARAQLEHVGHGQAGAAQLGGDPHLDAAQQRQRVRAWASSAAPAARRHRRTRPAAIGAARAFERTGQTKNMMLPTCSSPTKSPAVKASASGAPSGSPTPISSRSASSRGTPTSAPSPPITACTIGASTAARSSVPAAVQACVGDGVGQGDDDVEAGVARRAWRRSRRTPPRGSAAVGSSTATTLPACTGAKAMVLAAGLGARLEVGDEPAGRARSS